MDHVVSALHNRLGSIQGFTHKGRLVEFIGPILKAAAPRVTVGELCALRTPGRSDTVWAEVVGFTGDKVLLTPITDPRGLSQATEVIPLGRGHRVRVGEGLLGRVLGGMGEPLDAPLPDEEDWSEVEVMRPSPDPLTRAPIADTLETGIRVIDGLLTCGIGQRVGIFAAAGVGKSTLLAALMQHTQADTCVLALIGERGREVREFLDRHMPPDLRARCVTVVATSDQPAMQRARAAFVATAIAEHFRDRGQHVLLLMDSVTRLARALREVGLAAGEPPTRNGYPASTFAVLPGLLERAGPAEHGTITAFYTVLVEGDDHNEPVADEVRSLIDGHIILSRALAEKNHYPAIDVLKSRSRVMEQVASPTLLPMAGAVRELMAKYQDMELLVQLGEYEPGRDELADQAMNRHAAIVDFLCQDGHTRSPLANTEAHLRHVLED